MDNGIVAGKWANGQWAHDNKMANGHGIADYDVWSVEVCRSVVIIVWFCVLVTVYGTGKIMVLREPIYIFLIEENAGENTTCLPDLRKCRRQAMPFVGLRDKIVS